MNIFLFISQNCISLTTFTFFSTTDDYVLTPDAMRSLLIYLNNKIHTLLFFKFLEKLKLIQVHNGKSYLLYNNYTYSFKTSNRFASRWRCTLTSACNAFIWVANDNTLLRISGTHTHEPPKYHMKSDGTYIKV